MVSRKAALLVALVFGFALASCTKDEEPEALVEPSFGDSAEPPVAEDAYGEDIVYFAFDDYTLSMEAQDTLARVADRVKADPSTTIQIEGHCDERGTIEYNLALGQRRAESVKSYLVRMGVEGSRLSTISYGEERPRTEGHNESAWSQNRRAEFIFNR